MSVNTAPSSPTARFSELNDLTKIQSQMEHKLIIHSTKTHKHGPSTNTSYVLNIQPNLDILSGGVLFNVYMQTLREFYPLTINSRIHLNTLSIKS